MNTTAIRLDASLNTPQAITEELDEGTGSYRVNRERYTLHKDDDVWIERWIQEAQDNWEPAGYSDEIVCWSNSANVRLQRQEANLRIDIDDRTFVIKPDNPEQRFTLQIAEDQAPEEIGAHFDWPLRLDSGASRGYSVVDRPIKKLKIAGTPQFQRRVLAHLQSNPELEDLIDHVRDAANSPDVPMIIMQLHVGTRPVFGPWASGLELHQSPEIILLYNPYD